MTVRDLVIAAAARLKRVGIPDASLEAESLLAHALGRDAVWIVGHPEQALDAAAIRTYAAMIARRARREPFAYVIGEKWFYGRRFTVRPGVLVPRPSTEILIEAVLGLVPKSAAATIIDVGAGSGAIGLTLSAERPKARTVLYDVSRKALDVARDNTKRLKLSRRIRLAKLDILRQSLSEPKQAKMRDRAFLPAYVIVVANLPYLPLAQWKDAAPEVRGWEPKLALVSGADGLDHYRALFKQIARWKRAPSVLALEAEPGQFAELSRLASALMPAARIDVVRDFHGDERILIASKRKRP
mgnify:CR=1 FL=1